MNNLPPYWNSAIFNSAAFQSVGYLTKQDADRLYLAISAGANLGLISGLTPGTASASKALILDASSNITGINSLGTTTLVLGGISLGATQANYLTSITPGTASASKAIVLDASKNISGLGTIAQTVASGGDMLTLTSSASSARNTIKFITDTQTWEIGTRGSTASNPNTLYMYNGAYKFLMQPSGDTSILSSTASTSKTTGALVVTGGIASSGDYYGNRCTLDSSGSHLAFVNSFGSGLIELDATPQLRIVRGYAMNIGASGIGIGSGSASAGRYPIDFGSSAGDIQICFSQNGSNASYGIGANSSQMNYCSASGHRFTKSVTGGVLGSTQFLIDSSSNCTSALNLIAAGGVHANGISSTGLAALGPSAHMHFAASTAAFFGYDYSGGGYTDQSLGNSNIFIKASNGFVGINGTNPIFPLQVMGTANATRAGTFGWLSSAGSGSASGFTNRPFSLYTDGGILVNSGEIDSFSDIRMKRGITPLNIDICDRFMKATPIQFQYLSEESREHLGWSAQELMSLGMTHLVGIVDADEPLEPMTIDCVDGSTIELPSDKRLTLSALDIVPILHAQLKRQQALIEENTRMIIELRGLLSDSAQQVTSSSESQPVTSNKPRRRIILR
jgi:hypothetical protein